MELDTKYTANRRHKLNIDYFETIDCEAKAYWLGFLWADGGMSKTTKSASGYNRLTIAQHEKEYDHIVKFQQAIECDYEIKQQPKHIVALDINSTPFCQHLEALGYARKDKRTNIPPIPTYLIRHFIRGYFDGDGCLSVYIQHVQQYNIRKQEWSLTGNREFLINIAEILRLNVGVSNNVGIKEYKRTNKAITIRYGKAADVANLYHYMYDSATVYLESKHEKFMQFFENHPEYKSE